MAAQMKFAEYTVGTDRVSLTTALGLSERIFISTVLAQADDDNTNNVFVGGPTVTALANRGGRFSPGKGASVDMDGSFFSSNDVHFIADAEGQVMYFWWAA